MTRTAFYTFDKLQALEASHAEAIRILRDISQRDELLKPAFQLPRTIIREIAAAIAQAEKVQP